MKKSVIIFAVIFALISCAKVDINLEKSNVEATVKGFYAAVEKLEFDSLEVFCTPEFRGFEANTEYSDLKSFQDVLKSFNATSNEFEINILNTDITRDMAFTEIEFEGKVITGNGNLNIKARETYILKKVNNKWLIAYFHSSHYPDAVTLAKGNMLGFHVLTGISLKPGVTMEQAVEFLTKTYIPEVNKISPEIKLVALKGLRGAEKDKTGLAYYFVSDDVRNRFWEAEGTLSSAGEEYFKKFDALNAEAGKLYTIESTVYTDWVVK